MIRLGLIGCGDYCARTHASFFSTCTETQIIAISECVRPGELLQRQLQFHIPYSFSTYQQMLHSVELDGVVISTPHTQHFAQTNLSLELGLHVLLDKPPSCHVEEIEVLVELAESQGRHLVVACPRRYDPLFQMFRNVVEREELGELRFVELHSGRGRLPTFGASWRNEPTLSGGGVLFDAGYHVLDTLLWVTNRRLSRVFGTTKYHKTNVETAVALALELEGGLPSSVSVHLDMPDQGSQEEISLFGSEGALLYRYLSFCGQKRLGQLIKIHKQDRSSEEVPRCTDSDFASARNYVDAILGRASVQSSGAQSVETIRAIVAAYQSLGERSSV